MDNNKNMENKVCFEKEKFIKAIKFEFEFRNLVLDLINKDPDKFINYICDGYDIEFFYNTAGYIVLADKKNGLILFIWQSEYYEDDGYTYVDSYGYHIYSKIGDKWYNDIQLNFKGMDKIEEILDKYSIKPDGVKLLGTDIYINAQDLINSEEEYEKFVREIKQVFEKYIDKKNI